MSNIIATLLAHARAHLSESKTPQLDAEILLAHVLNVPRTYLYTWPDKVLEKSQIEKFESYIERRAKGEPIAYIIEQKSFWSFLDLKVTPDVLIPRPETELLIEQALTLFPEDKLSKQVADLGTGSGAIALALAAERPYWQIMATDYSADSLAIARENIKYFGFHRIQCCQGDWCQPLPHRHFDLIVTNPPYISKKELPSLQKEIQFEPLKALVAEQDGLADILVIIEQARFYLKKNGWLILEHGYTQGEKVRRLLVEYDYSDVNTRYDLQGTERISFGSMRKD